MTALYFGWPAFRNRHFVIWGRLCLLCVLFVSAVRTLRGFYVHIAYTLSVHGTYAACIVCIVCVRLVYIAAEFGVHYLYCMFHIA